MQKSWEVLKDVIIYGRRFRFYHGQIAPMAPLAPPAHAGLSELRLTPFALHLGEGCWLSGSQNYY